MTPWTVAYQAPLPMGFPKQESWSGLLFPTAGIFLTQGLNLCLLCLLRWQAGSLSLHHLEAWLSIRRDQRFKKQGSDSPSFLHLLLQKWISSVDRRLKLQGFQLCSSSSGDEIRNRINSSSLANPTIHHEQKLFQSRGIHNRKGSHKRAEKEHNPNAQSWTRS